MADDQVILHYRIPAELHARIKAAAQAKGQSLRIWVEWALDAEAERQETERAEQERKRRSR